MEVRTCRAAVLLNMAAAYMALGDFHEAARRCTTALEEHPQDVKGLLRRAR